MINIAINGFGRIGRAIFKAGAKDKNICIKYINDVSNASNLAYLLKHDSVLGKFECDIKEKTLIVQGRETLFLNFKHPKEYNLENIDVVVESSGAFLDFNSLLFYLKNGAKNVILSAPYLDSNQVKTYIIGVNEDSYRKEKIISNASCSANAIAPILKTIKEKYKIICGNSTTIHPFSNNQSLLDSSNAMGARFSRNANINTIPSKSNIGEIIGILFNELKGKFHGDSIRVPTSLVSFSNIDLVLESRVKKDDILNLSFPKIIGLDESYLVSSDFIGDSRSAIIATDLVNINNNVCRIPIWFDNESAYANRILDMVKIMHKS